MSKSVGLWPARTHVAVITESPLPLADASPRVVVRDFFGGGVLTVWAGPSMAGTATTSAPGEWLRCLFVALHKIAECSPWHRFPF